MHSSFFPDCFHRVTVKGMCVRDGKVLLVLEPQSMSGKWELPGGGLEFGENIRDALVREVQEETGLKVTKVSDHPVYVWTHRYEANVRNIGWYYSCVLAYRIELESLDFTKTEECGDIRFFTKEELKDETIINQQIVKLGDIFKAEDFTENF